MNDDLQRVTDELTAVMADHPDPRADLADPHVQALLAMGRGTPLGRLLRGYGPLLDEVERLRRNVRGEMCEACEDADPERPMCDGCYSALLPLLETRVERDEARARAERAEAKIAAVEAVVAEGIHADTCAVEVVGADYPCHCWKADVAAALAAVPVSPSVSPSGSTPERVEVAKCERGCGCRYGSTDPDVHDCACDGPCTMAGPKAWGCNPALGGCGGDCPTCPGPGLTPERVGPEPSVYDEIRAERERAHAKHGETSMERQPPDALLRLAILMEEVGEVAREFNDARHRTERGGNPYIDALKVRKELIQTAAMSAAWADALTPQIERAERFPVGPEPVEPAEVPHDCWPGFDR